MARGALVPLLAVAATAVAAFAVGYRTGGGDDALDVQEALLDEDVRDEVLRELVAGAEGFYDAHSDPDVGRVLLPRVDALGFGEVAVVTNGYGLRERDYALPRPDDTVRVVLLGDSFVFGSGVEAEERFGVHLERHLRERAAVADLDVEVLHVGVSSWDVVAACAYVRRQLDLLRPDLVVHVTVPNDLDDVAGARGHGGRGLLAPRRRARADSLLKGNHPRKHLGFNTTNHLAAGLDEESRARFGEAREHLLGLAAAVEAAGGRYLLLLHWGEDLAVPHHEWALHLEPRQAMLLSPAAFANRELRLDRNDPHWNPRGHAWVATVLYGAIQSRGLLPRLRPAAWPQARRLFDEEQAAARGAALDLAGLRARRAEERPIAPTVLPGDWTEDTAAQVHGGIDRDGRIGPYASLVLATAGGDTLTVEGTDLGRPELAGARVVVRVEGEPVGEITVGGGFAHHYPLPEDVRERPYVTVAFEADDYVYTDVRRQECRVLTLRRVYMSGP